MGWDIGLPSFSEVRARATQALDSAVGNVRDFGNAAVERGADLGRAGLDLGRRAVETVRSIDVRDAAQTVRQGIGDAAEAGRSGISTGVRWASERTGEAADFARSQITGDDLVSRAARGAITTGENVTRFQIGVVGGVAREVVGTVGVVGQLGTTLAEMQVSPEARVEYGQRIANGVTDAATATATYVEGAVRDPSRVGTDVGAIVDAGGRFVNDQIGRYDAAIRSGQGAETIGLDVGTVATYLIPVGGGPARGAVTAVAREGAEAAVREGTEALVREGSEALVRGGSEAIVREGGEAVVRRETATAATAATAAERNTVTLYRVDDAAFPPRITPEGAVPVVTTRSGGERALFVNIDQPQRAAEFALVNRGGNATVTAVEVDASLLERLRATAVHDTGPAAAANPTAPLVVDITKAPDQYGLRTPEQIQMLRDAIVPGTARVVDPNTLPR